jgi:integration host factor subunit alpha
MGRSSFTLVSVKKPKKTQNLLTPNPCFHYSFQIRENFIMSDKTLTRMDLGEAVFREVGLSRNESSDLVETVLDHISDALVDGQNVKISSFGTFSIRDKKARVGRNPKTGEEVPITPRRVLTFRPSQLMKERVSEGNKSN